VVDAADQGEQFLLCSDCGGLPKEHTEGRRSYYAPTPRLSNGKTQLDLTEKERF